MNALEVERAIRQHTNWRHSVLIPECPVRLLRRVEYWAGRELETYHDYFADFMCVSGSDYAMELEVKVSRADWAADAKKPKWKLPFVNYIARFVYVVPHGLLPPNNCPPQAGIWYVRDGSIDVYRAPKRIGKERVPAEVKARWMSCFYYRYWQQRIDMEHAKFKEIDRWREHLHEAL